MTEITLEMQFALSQKILDELIIVRGDIREIKQRITLLEEGQAGLHREVSNLYGLYATQSGRFDRLEDRLERIERRLELREEQP